MILPIKVSFKYLVEFKSSKSLINIKEGLSTKVANKYINDLNSKCMIIRNVIKMIS